MRANEFIAESKSNPLTLIKDGCKPFLQQWDGRNMLYRGIQGITDDFIRKPIRLDRQSMNIATETHNAFIQAFVTLGFKAHRGNSMFATSDYTEAHEYAMGGISPGSIYAVFPYGPFDFTWSSMVKDMWFTIGDFDDPISDVADAIDWIEGHRYRDDKLNEAIRSGNEVMIAGNGYYGIKHDYIKRNGVREVANYLKS